MNFRIFIFLFILSNGLFAQSENLRESIQKIIQSKKTTVGVSILGLEDKDTLSINGNKSCVMFSVVKFPTALAVLHQVDKGQLSLEQKVFIKKSDLNPDTYSPMRDDKPEGDYETTVSKLLSYAVSKSDNIAYEKLAELMGGIGNVNKYIQSLGIPGISIVSTYKEGIEATLKNQMTPQAATALLKKAYQGKILKKDTKAFLWKIMEETSTGPDRLKALLPAGTVVAHKTGTSGMVDGFTVACNDVGVVALPSGKHYIISVFVTNSTESEATNAKIIAEISKTAYDYFLNKK